MDSRTGLDRYVREELRGDFVYNGYRPRTDLLSSVAEHLPKAQVTVISDAQCRDCRREVPKLARILEHLPGWTVELLDRNRDDPERLGVRAVPTFIVRDPASGRELDRIIEAPSTGSLESDLLTIAERWAKTRVA